MKFDLARSAGTSGAMRLWLTTTLAIIGLASSGCGLGGGGDPTEDDTTRDDSGQVIEGGSLGVNALKLGDCFNDGSSATTDEVTDVLMVEAVPCSEPHEREVYYLGALPDTEYPGSDLVNELVLDQCLTVFEAFAGISYEDSRLDIARIFPSEANWADDDRGYICLVYDVANIKLEGSMRGRGY